MTLFVDNLIKEVVAHATNQYIAYHYDVLTVVQVALARMPRGRICQISQRNPN